MKRRIFRYVHDQHGPQPQRHGYTYKASVYQRLQRQRPWIMAQWICHRNWSISSSATVRADAFRLASSL